MQVTAMPSVPVPVFTLAILVMLLAKVSLTGADRYRQVVGFLAACSLLVFLSALRWSFDLPLLRQLQSLTAIALPPFAWQCFSKLTSQPRRRQTTVMLVPAVMALFVNLAFPVATDVALTALYFGYGIALLSTARHGADAFLLSRLSEAPAAAKIAAVAGAFLCFCGLTDIAIAADFGFFDGRQAPLLVAVSQIILLPFLCLALLLPFSKPVIPDTVTPPPTASITEPESESAEDAQRCARLEDILHARSLYLNPDLTLDLLARKTGIPARQISRAVNATRGCNVSQWINGFRIAHAQSLLRQTDAPVTRVMLESGFNTKSNFNREFGRMVGMSPVDYRRAAVNSAAPDSETGLSAALTADESPRG